MVVLNMSLYFALEAVGVDGLGLMAVWVVAIGDWTSVDVFSFLGNIIETVMATKSGRNRPDIVFLVLR